MTIITCFYIYFLPWRDENELIAPYNRAAEEFDHQKDLFEVNEQTQKCKNINYG